VEYLFFCFNIFIIDVVNPCSYFYYAWSYEVNSFIFIVHIRYRVRRFMSMNLVLEQETGLLSYLVHLMKPRQRRAFSKHLFLVAHHDRTGHVKSCNIQPCIIYSISRTVTIFS